MTENNELVERAKAILYDDSIRTIDESMVRIIALVEADVRERLLSDEAKTTAAARSQRAGEGVGRPPPHRARTSSVCPLESTNEE